MRAAFVIVALVCCAGCAPQPPILVRATGEGYSCTLTVNGAVVANDPQLRAVERGGPRAVIVDTDMRTPYRCVGGAIVRLQGAGFKVVAVTANGMKLPGP